MHACLSIVNGVNKLGEQPLHKAVERANSGMVSMLLECGADLYSRSYDGNSPLHIACDNGKLEIAKQLLECVEHLGDWERIKIFEVVNKYKRTPIESIPRRERPTWQSVIKLYDSWKQDFNQQQLKGQTAKLSHAIQMLSHLPGDQVLYASESLVTQAIEYENGGELVQILNVDLEVPSQMVLHHGKLWYWYFPDQATRACPHVWTPPTPLEEALQLNQPAMVRTILQGFDDTESGLDFAN